MMSSSTPRNDAIGVALAIAGAALIVLGLAALWLIVPVAGAALTIVFGALLVAAGVRTLVRVPR